MSGKNATTAMITAAIEFLDAGEREVSLFVEGAGWVSVSSIDRDLTAGVIEVNVGDDGDHKRIFDADRLIAVDLKVVHPPYVGFSS